MLTEAEELELLELEDEEARSKAKASESKMAAQATEKPGLLSATFPRTTEKGIKGLASDISSLPGRAISSIGEGGNYLENLARLEAPKRSGLIGAITSGMENIFRDPATAPSMAIGGPILAGLGKIGLASRFAKGAITGLAEGGTSAGIHAAESPDVSPGRIALETATGPLARGVGGALSFIGKGASAIGQGFKETVPETLSALKAGETVAPITNRFGIEFTPGMVSGPKDSFRQFIEQKAQLSPGLSDIPGAIKEKNVAAVEEALSGQRRGFVNPSKPGTSEMSEAGFVFKTKLGEAKTGLEETFRKGEEESIALAKEAPLKTRTAVEKGRQGFFSINETQEDLKKYLASKGYKGGVKETMHGIVPDVTGNEELSGNTINFIYNLDKNLNNAKTVGDLLNQRRNIQDAIYNGKWQDQLFSGRDHAAMNEVYGTLNKNIGNAIEKQFPGKEGARIRKLWESNNAEYADTRNLIEQIDRGMGISKESMSAEKYFNNVKNVGVENLIKLQEAAKKNTNLAPVYANMQAGFFDNFLKRSLNAQTMELSPTRLATNWEALDIGVKKAMLGDKVVSDMDEIINSVRKLKMTDVEFTNPSGSGREIIRAEQGKIKNWLFNMIMRGPVKDYYKTGSVSPVETAVNIISKTGSFFRGSGAAISGAGKITPYATQLGRSLTFNEPEINPDLAKINIRR